MRKLEDLKAELLSLQVELVKMQGEGKILTDCWIAKAKPGGKKNKYPRLKSRRPIFNGKKTEYLSIHGLALVEAEAAIARGKTIKKLDKRIRTLSEQISQVQYKLSKNLKASTRKKSQDWYAPPELIALVRLVMEEIDLDPVSSDMAQQWIQATSYYNHLENGLANPWFGRVWLHPPTRGKTVKWINKLFAEYESGRVSEAILLVKLSASCKWFQKLTKSLPICFPDESIVFLDNQGKPQPQPKHGNVIFYFGHNLKRFKEVFGAIGSVSSPVVLENLL